MRPPEVFVRELLPEEGSRLKSISKKAKYQSKRQRAMILLASATGMSAPQIAAMARTDESHVRKVIHAFNEQGFGSLDPDYRGGRPKKTTPEQRDRIVAVARARPDTQGVALTRWSLAKLARAPGRPGDRAVRGGAAPDAARRRALSHQRTRSWKWSPDPDFAAKAERVLSLYRAKPDDGVVVCFDEMGPIQLIPHHGSGWAPPSGPSGCARPTPSPTGCATCSAPTTCTPTACTAACAPTRTPSEVLAFYRQIRMRYDPRLRALPDRRQPLDPQDPGDPRMGRGAEHRAGVHADLRQLPQPHRVPLLGDRRVRHQQRRLPRLGRPRPKRWPTTSATATDPTATNASSPPNVNS